MEQYSRIATTVLKKLNKLKRMRDLHLTSVAKAIEVASEDNIKIIFRGEPTPKPEKPITGATLSQEFEVQRPGCDKPQKIREHLIYYSKRRNLDETRYFVGHELGHILLHHTNEDIERKYVTVPESTEADFYIIQFEESEEAEADMFAAILSEQRQRPRRPSRFVLPCIRKMIKLKKRDLIQSTLQDLVPDKVSCVYKGAPEHHCTYI